MSEITETEEGVSSRFLAETERPYGSMEDGDDVPVDQGWAWVVLADLPVLMILLRYQSVRTCQLIGIIISTLAYALSSLTSRLDILILCQSVLNGLSIALIVPTGIVQVGRYFRKHIGLANGVLMAGLSLGGLVMPSLIQLIVQEYTLHGALLLTSAIVLNALPAAVLQRPPEFYRRLYKIKWKQRLATSQEMISCESENTNNVNEMDLLVGTKNKNKLGYQISTSETKLSTLHSKRATRREKDVTLTSNSMPELLHSQHQTRHKKDIHFQKVTDINEFRHFSSMSAFECASVPNLSLSPERRSKEQAKSDLGSEDWLTVSCIPTVIASCKESGRILLKNKIFLIFVAFYTTGTISNETVTIYLPPHAKETGIESSNIAWLISIHSVCDFLGRVLCGYLADLRWMKKHNLILVSQVVTALLPQFIYLYDTFFKLAIFAALFGLMSGVVFAISSPVLKDIVNEEHFASAIAVAIFVKGAVLGGMIPLLGYLRDLTGTYHVTFHCMGATSVLAVCVLILFAIVISKHSP
ncbi:monocarboxylate transporter 9-like isoform X2 [Mizuhopecten yessoensis]|uniref:monocarboxylate transporter 9-like isoform X2 n=1 Tax=Mizuhopecten yessoensis TaxID=6573 RepID=UPI000B458605|nr:monocarboxylate transporter 9-like isoform X2 [Mizuhopecten yessoensis]